jgi:hypothetical protein
MVFWNQSNLYRKKDDRGVETFSTYPEESKIKIYELKYWQGDDWDPMAYGRKYDFNRPFFEQFRELMYAVPWPSRSIAEIVNSDYSNNANNLKNCYLCFNANNSGNCLYSVGFAKGKDLVDGYAAIQSELCYEVYQAGDCFQTFFGSGLTQCRNVWFSRDCVDCSDCFGCVNLRHKQYHWFNEPLTKDEYKKRVEQAETGSYAYIEKTMAQTQVLWLKLPHKNYQGLHNLDVSGDYVYHSKNAHDVFEVGELENVRYAQNLAEGVKDAYDYTNWGSNSSLIYEVVDAGMGLHNVRFSAGSYSECRNIEYCMKAQNAEDCFGCVGIRKKRYCILNRQYSKEEYFLLRAKIIEHMNAMPYTDAQGRVYRYGEFFPPEFSPLGYGQSVAIDYYPTTREKAEKEGYPWYESKEKEFSITKESVALSDDLSGVDDSILKEVLGCAVCKKAYRIIDREYAFLKRFNIALPRLCVRCRYKKRLSVRNPLKWQRRKCQCAGTKDDKQIYMNTGDHFHKKDHCPNTFETSYAPDCPEIVYCESCYQSEVV